MKKEMQVSYLTPDEAAEILRVTPKSVYRWLRGGKLKGRKIGGKVWRIPAHAVVAKREEK